MTAYTFRNVGAADQHTGPCTAGAPAGVVAGDLLLLHACSRSNAITLTTPSGWVKLNSSLDDTYNNMFGRIADGTGADTPPTLTWSGSAPCQAQCCAFFGDVYTDLSTIVHAVVDQSGNGAGADGNSVQYNALTISLANCLVIARGMHNKTTAGNAASPVMVGLSGFTDIAQQNPSGAVFSAYWAYKQQTTATNLSVVIQARTAPVENLQQSSLFLALKTASASSSANKGFIINQQCING
jgi:hypothetical protein